MAPQNPHLKQKTWNNLEKLCRSLTKRYLNVYVCSGPLYLPRQEANGKLFVRYQVIRRNHVAVLTHFFKVLILEQGDSGASGCTFYRMNQSMSIFLWSFLVLVETIERPSGLLFDPNIMKRTSTPLVITHK